MIVLKFGGSSLADSAKIKNISEIIKNSISEKPIIVCSAIGKTTDYLLEASAKALEGTVDITKIKEINELVLNELEVEKTTIAPLFEELTDLLNEICTIKELTPRERDYLVSFGERLSVRIISEYLNNKGITAKFFDGWDAGFVTDSVAENAEILEETYSNISQTFSGLETNYEFTPIVTGFIGKDKEGHVTTLGRGGSDLTASVIGAAINAKEIQYWKDVNGILTTDPRMVKTALPIKQISFEEASEMAFFGAKIFHPKSILPAMKYGIPVRVKNSLKPEVEGTLILKKIDSSKEELVKAISFKKGIAIVDIVSTRMLGQHGFLAKVFDVFEEEKISVDVVSTSEVSISLTVSNTSCLACLGQQLEKIADVNFAKNNAIVSIVCDITKSSEILSKAFDALAKEKINVKMISQGASKVNISFIIDEEQMEKTVKILHKLFFEKKEEN